MKPNELIKWRKKNSYSQSELARTLGVHVLTISRWERGIREIPEYLYRALRDIECERKMKGDRENG